jgi:hypothetical protein
LAVRELVEEKAQAVGYTLSLNRLLLRHQADP